MGRRRSPRGPTAPAKPDARSRSLSVKRSPTSSFSRPMRSLAVGGARPVPTRKPPTSVAVPSTHSAADSGTRPGVAGAPGPVRARIEVVEHQQDRRGSAGDSARSMSRISPSAALVPPARRHVPPEPSPARAPAAPRTRSQRAEITAAPRARASRANAMTRVVLPMPVGPPIRRSPDARRASPDRTTPPASRVRSAERRTGPASAHPVRWVAGPSRRRRGRGRCQAQPFAPGSLPPGHAGTPTAPARPRPTDTAESSGTPTARPRARPPKYRACISSARAAPAAETPRRSTPVAG